MPTRPTQRRVTDPRDLRALAHPLRIAILEDLTLHGPMTATQLGDRLEESPANCSWHLRKLAEHGFVEEAGGGRGRARPWQVTHVGMSWDEAGATLDDAGPAEAELASEALSQVLVDREVARFAEARARLRHDDPAWRAAADSSQSMLWLTPEELAEVNHAVRDLLMSRFERHADPSARPAGARLCAFMAWGVPAYGRED